MQWSRMPSDSPSQSDSSAISGRRSTIAFFIPGVRSSNASYTQVYTASSSTIVKHTPLWALWVMIQEEDIKNHKIPNKAQMQWSRTPSDSPSQSDSSAISGRRSTIAFFIPGVRSSNASYTQVYTASSSTISVKHTPLWASWVVIQEEWTLRIIKCQTKHKCNDQELCQTARRNLTHQQSVEGEVQLRFSSQAFEVPMPLTPKYIQLVRVLLLNILHYELYELWFWSSGQ